VAARMERKLLTILCSNMPNGLSSLRSMRAATYELHLLNQLVPVAVHEKEDDLA